MSRHVPYIRVSSRVCGNGKHCNTLQHTATHTQCNSHSMQHILTATHCNTHSLQHTHTATHTQSYESATEYAESAATHCNTLQQTATHTHCDTHKYLRLYAYLRIHNMEKCIHIQTSVCVCVYIYIYMYIRILTHAYTNEKHRHIHTCMYICICTYIHSEYRYTRVHEYTPLHQYMRTTIHAWWVHNSVCNSVCIYQGKHLQNSQRLDLHECVYMIVHMIVYPCVKLGSFSTPSDLISMSARI